MWACRIEYSVHMISIVVASSVMSLISLFINGVIGINASFAGNGLIVQVDSFAQIGFIRGCDSLAAFGFHFYSDLLFHPGFLGFTDSFNSIRVPRLRSLASLPNVTHTGLILPDLNSHPILFRCAFSQYSTRSALLIFAP